MLKRLYNFCLSNSLKSAQQKVPTKEIPHQYSFRNAFFKSTATRRSMYLFGFCAAGVVGVYGGNIPAGMNFKMSPHFTAHESYLSNLKAMAISLMMTDGLDEDERHILMNAVESAYDDDMTKLSNKRKAWCYSEMKNYMNCSEKHGNFKDERCSGYRMLLKNCLQAKKGAAEFTPPKLEEIDLPPACKNNSHCAPVHTSKDGTCCKTSYRCEKLSTSSPTTAINESGSTCSDNPLSACLEKPKSSCPNVLQCMVNSQSNSVPTSASAQENDYIYNCQAQPEEEEEITLEKCSDESQQEEEFDELLSDQSLGCNIEYAEWCRIQKTAHC